MTEQMKTDNELIAKFMDEPLEFTHDMGYQIASGTISYDDYYNNWDNLMPVIEKIGTIELKGGRYGKHVDFIISTTELSGWIFWLMDVPGDQNQPQSYPAYNEGTLIERTKKSVVEFIKWYNQQSL